MTKLNANVCWTRRYGMVTAGTVGLWVLGWGQVVSAATFTVNSLLDVVDANDGKLTLREAIIAANGLAGPDNIFFNPFLAGTIKLTGGELVINSDLNIVGNGANALTVSGENTSRVFKIDRDKVTLSRMTIAQGNSSAFPGGGIVNAGNLTVQACTVKNNSAGNGGGIFNLGTLTVSNSTFSANSAADIGGGIYNFGTLTVNGSTFNANSARGGGGIFNLNILTVNNSIFRGNSATLNGGGIFIFSGSVTLTANLIQQNKAANGGGVFNTTGTVRLGRNLISLNTLSPATGVGPDLNGAFVSNSGNVIGKGGGFTGITNLVNGDIISVP